MSLDTLIHLLQVAISPVILISAVGLLLLTMNNRLAHAIDRARNLVKEGEKASDSHKAHLREEIEVIWFRTRNIRYSIALASVSALCAALLIIVLFLTELIGLHHGWIISSLFIASLSALIISLVFLIVDVNKSLIALKLELEWNDSQNGR
ncbi:MAG: DUF2721 domain-containing protein [Methylococcaceae bacterium]|nr:DUF2721 domain-containing protein [Methylococcaceae bacterium]